MKINVDTVLKQLNGLPLKEGDNDFTLKSAAIEALMLMSPDDQAGGEEKFSRYNLAIKVNAGGEVELTPEEAAMIKQRIGKIFGPSVLGPAWTLLNG